MFKHLLKISNNIIQINALVKLKNTSLTNKMYFNFSNNKFANEEESLDILLKEFNNKITDFENKNCNNVENKININYYIKQKENILFVNNELLNNIKQGQIVSFNNFTYFAQVISIQNKISVLLLINYAKNINFNNINLDITNYIDSIKSNKDNILDNNMNLKTNSNYSLLEIISNKNVIQNSSKLNNNIMPYYRNISSKQLFTGSCMIDYINPIYKGNFCIIKGFPNQGQEEIIESILSRQDSNIVLLTLNSKLYKTVNKIKELNNKIYIYYSLKDNNNISDIYFLPRLALEKVRQLKQVKNSDTLFIYDGYYDFFISEKSIMTNAKIYSLSRSIISDIYEECGSFANNSSSLSAIVVIKIVYIIIKIIIII